MNFLFFDLLQLRIAFLLFFLFLASITDIQKRIVPDKLSYSMILIALIINLIEFNLINFIPAIIVFVIGLILYFLGKLGGGDIKVLTALTLMIPFFHDKTFVLPVLIYASLLSLMFYSIYFSLKLLRKKAIKLNEIKTDLIRSLVLFVFLIAYLIILANFYSLSFLLFFFVPLFFGLIFLALQKEIKKEFFLKELPLNELDEDEVIAFEFLSKELQEKFKLKKIITENDKKFLKEKGINKIKVYQQMPAFIPFIFLGAIIALIKPELLSGLLVF